MDTSAVILGFTKANPKTATAAMRKLIGFNPAIALSLPVIMLAANATPPTPPSPTIIMTTDTTVGVVASLGVVAGDEAPPADDGGLLALCLMMLTPGLALGLWLLAIAARGGGWRLPRLVPWVVAALDVAGLPPPFERQLTVLRI